MSCTPSRYRGIASTHLPASPCLLAARNRSRCRCLAAAEDPCVVPAGGLERASFPWQQCLNFRPLPHGHGSLRPTLAVALAAAPIRLIRLIPSLLAKAGAVQVNLVH